MTSKPPCDWLTTINTAATIDALETAIQAHLSVMYHSDAAMQKTAWNELHHAAEHRGWDLVNADPHGHLIPRIVRKPSSFRAIYRGQRYPGGSWQNGAGYRWDRYALERWVQTLGEFSTRSTASRVVDWVLSRWPHRALRAVYQELEG